MRSHTHSQRSSNAPLNRVQGVILGIVLLAFGILLVWSSFNNGRPVGWQMRIINHLAEIVTDNVALVYDRSEERR